MAGLTELTQEEAALFYLGRMIYSQAYMLAFRDCFLILTFVFLLAIIPGLLIRKRKAAPVAAPPPMGQMAPAGAGE